MLIQYIIQGFERENPPREVDALGQFTAVGRPKKLSLELRELGANIALLAVPMIDGYVSLELTAGSHVLTIIVLLGWDPAVSGSGVTRLGVTRLGVTIGLVDSMTAGLSVDVVDIRKRGRHVGGVERVVVRSFSR